MFSGQVEGETSEVRQNGCEKQQGQLLIYIPFS